MRKAVLLVGFLLATTVVNVALANDSVADFAVRQAHDRGFRYCDSGIRDALAASNGSEDARILTDAAKELAADQLTLAAIWGRPGDTVFTEMTMRVKADQCVVQHLSTTVVSASCERWLENQSAFRVRAVTLGVRFAKNAGGVDAILQPAGQDSCLIVYRRAGKY